MIPCLLSVIFGTISTMIIGFYWYSILFHDRYLKEANIKLEKDHEQKDESSQPLILELLARFLQASLITYLYSILKIKNERDLGLALSLAVFFCVSFQVQYFTSKVVWEQKTWNYFFMKVTEQFISLSTLSTITYIFVP
ncbi:unnamed protein product (macronuclear) [Paramecium tetraurelia]|uniref:Uncharacterized protein n=1 Tax=Paramecium tetraurelia TaxID=5888 RepID=A0BNM9_PARTE|nr:uncharacterized protein GSPATT00030785001 [Paramecium tetraurelia]CAK60146.1 unnamed protein product [Paramecium tetraurelia]|eukprot:XP_001427544.1 hypothetical protein (macronuclear) [Paramecium tetraurelia strain d4-2]